MLDASLTAWQTLWTTTIGSGALGVPLAELDVPATVVGHFFELLLVRELHQRDPYWRRGENKEEKDLVYERDLKLSIEIKVSGQRGFQVYGNRSFGQKATSRKDKSGYYITVNFFGRTLTLVRFGWIDSDDWCPQRAPTGQMAGLKKAVYDYKLIPIPGSYRQESPVCLLEGVGAKTEQELGRIGIATVGDLLHYSGEARTLVKKIRDKNQAFLDACR